MFNNKKYLPFYYLLSIVLFPFVFGYMLNYFFHLETLEHIYEFEKIIFSNLKSFRSFKFEVYLSAIFGIIPLIIVFVLSMPKNRSTTHGKAKWAKRSDIETYSFSLIKFTKDFFKLLNPLFWLNPKKFFKNILEFFKLGMQKKNKMGVNFGNGFILGLWEEMSGKKRVCYNQPLSALIVAPPGAGKTTGIAVPNLLHLRTSCIVLDIKGELCQFTAGYRQKALKNKILIFDPFGKGNTLKFNPFDKKIVSKLDFNGKRKLVDEIAQTIFVEEKGSDPHWINQARNLFIFYALYDLCVYGESGLFRIATATMRDYKPYIQPLSPYYEQLWKHDDETGLLILKNGSPVQKQDADPEKLYFKQVSEQIYINPQDPRNFSQKARDENPDTDQEKPEEQKDPKNKRLDEIVRDYARAWSGGSGGDEFSSIKSTYNRVMQVFTSYQVKNVTDGMSFEYEDFRKENITLYIRIAQTDINTLAPLIRILLESIAKNLLLKESKKPEERIYFILDEFVRFGKLEFLLEMPALSRSYGVVVLFITQSNALIQKYYSDKDAEILGSTVNYKIVFKTDQKYAKELSEEIGKYTRKTQSYSTEKGKLIFGGTSTFNKEGVNLVTEQDILNLDENDVIILIKGFQATPLKLRTNHYFKDSSMMSKMEWELKPEKTSQNEQSSNPIFNNKSKAVPLPPKEKTINENQVNNDEGKLIEEENTSTNQSNIPIELTQDKQLKQLKIEYEYAKLFQTINDEDIHPPYALKDKKEYVLEITDKEILVRLMPPNNAKNINTQILSKLENEPAIQLAKERNLKLKFDPEE
ncbi:type IV secretory system conjugative DNA transfer family protein [Helicobacter sp. 11S03491-1]|uniref:type IV secretory system conjugative DNA transfer family protein n=1 Tax=Helicobacter sp. 11S03491-1 TaxID=1476196 RepID=UPI000BA5AD48|nr:type IV secretory system conjugative DNA transfer family protein [Helicobacter sp. 11S03491-1]PAF42167.1 hypothetical protein BKH45_04260 [Helicobacter sp. 11S03491-1]